MMIQKHCHQCGAPLVEKELEGEGIVPYCPQCQEYRFPMYNVAVSMVVVNEQTGEIRKWRIRWGQAMNHVSNKHFF